MYIQGLIKMGMDVWLSPMLWQGNKFVEFERHPYGNEIVFNCFNEICADSSESDFYLGKLYTGQAYNTVVMHVTPEYWPQMIEKDKKCLGYTTWETNKLPSYWAGLLNLADCVLVPSQFNKEVFSNYGVTRPIVTIPHILRVPEIVSGKTSKAICDHLEIDTNSIVFYSINEWSARKAPWKLLELFLKTFTAQDNVTLLMKTGAQGPKNETDRWSRPTESMVEEWVLKFSSPPPVRIINDTISQNSINAIHNIGDCFLSFCRGEGWGLGLFEAAGFGNPVLSTGWGGQVDYLSGLPNSLLDYQLIPATNSESPETHTKDHWWANVDEGQALDSMRYIYDNIDGVTQTAQQYKNQLQQNYSTEYVTQKLIDVIQ